MMFEVVYIKDNGKTASETLYTGQQLSNEKIPNITLVTASGQELERIWSNLPMFVPRGKKWMTWYGDIAKLVYEAFVD